MKGRSGYCLGNLVWLGLFWAIMTIAPGNAWAGLKVEKYVGINVTPSVFHMGEIVTTGDYDVPHFLKIHISANCVHAGVILSATPLEEPNGAKIDPSRILVKSEGMTQYLPLTAPLNLTGPLGPGIKDVIVNFRVQCPGMDPAGTYTGTFVFTSAPLP